MKTPVCDSDIRSGQLCKECTAKLAAGRITALDFEVAQILYKINERYNISNASFTKAIDLGKVALILTNGEVGLLIGKQGKVVSELSASLGKKVRIAQMQGDVKKTIADIIMPVQLIGINKAYHEGKELTKIRIAREDMEYMPFDVATLETILKTLLEEEVRVEIE